MSRDKTNSAVLVVLVAGLFWSFGPLVVRNIDNAELIPWQYLFFRGSVIFLVLNIYLFLAEGSKFVKNYNRIGLSGLILYFFIASFAYFEEMSCSFANTLNE